MSDPPLSIYQRLYEVSARLSRKSHFINYLIRKVNPGKLLWLLSIIQHLPAIKKEFFNWPWFLVECFGLIHKQPITITTRKGINIKVRSGTSDIGVVFDVFVHNCYQNTHARLTPGDTILDIGAHIGSFSLYMDSLADRLTIYAFEPDPENFQLLTENIKANRSFRIVPIQAAVSTAIGTSTLYKNQANPAGHTLYPEQHMRYSKLRVNTTTLQEIIRAYRLKHIRLLKLDCEGSEYDILQHTPAAILDSIEEIVLEYHPVHDLYQDSKLKAYLSKAGFSYFTTSPFPMHILHSYRTAP